MIKKLNFKAGSLKPQRWLTLALTLLTLSLIVGGCGQLGGGEDTAAQEAAVQRLEAAAEQAEAVAERIEAVAQQAEAAARRVEAVAEEAEAAAQQVASMEVKTGNDGGTQTTVAETETTAETGQAETSEPADNALKIGVIATLDGVYAALGEDGLRGVKMALAEFDNQINGRPIAIITRSSDGAAPDVALEAARQLIEEEQVDLLIGPLSGDEGLVVRDFAKDHPEKTFINGSSGAQDTTLRNSAPNFFRFNMDGAQWMAGLGRYAYGEKGYRRVATLAEDYSYPYSQVGGFLVDFCQAGGQVAEKFWVPLGTTDYSNVIELMPPDIDAIYVALGGTDSLNFIQQFDDFGGQLPIIAGSIMLDQTILGVEGNLANYLVGTPAAGPIADNNPDQAWQEFVATYQETFPDGLPSPSLFAHAYYLNTKAALLALDQVNGDLSDNQQAFQEALRNMAFDSPTGPVSLDENRQAIGTNFITEVAVDDDGKLYNKFVKAVPNVNQTLGIDPTAYLELGSLSRNNPLCEDIQALMGEASTN